MPYGRGKASIPIGSPTSCKPIDVPDEYHRNLLHDFNRSLMHCEDGGAGVLEDTGLGNLCYHNPVLASDPGLYTEIIAQLVLAHVVSLLGFRLDASSVRIKAAYVYSSPARV